MREYIVFALFLLLVPSAPAQTAPADWRVVKDSRSLCQIAVPSEWILFGDNAGAAVFKDAGTAIAVVTSQPGQAFQALPESILKSLDVPKDKVFENSAKHIFYQDKTSRNAEDPNAYSASLPRKGGICSCHLVFLPSVAVDVARKIALSLGPVPDRDVPDEAGSR